MSPLEFPPTMANLVRRAAREFADREYVVTAESTLTFAQLDQQSQRVAQWLLRRGVSKGTIVGILFPQGPDAVVALLAVTRIGAIAVPLSTFLRGAELRRAVRHADVDTLIAPSRFLGRDTAIRVRRTVARIADGAGAAVLPSRRAVPSTSVPLRPEPIGRG